MPEFLQPIEIIILRASISTILFWIVSYFLKKDAIQRKDYFMLALCGLFGVSINQLLFFEGLNLSNPVDASIIMATIPVMVFIFSVIGKLEKLTYLKQLVFYWELSVLLLPFYLAKKLIPVQIQY